VVQPTAQAVQVVVPKYPAIQVAQAAAVVVVPAVAVAQVLVSNEVGNTQSPVLTI